MKRLVLAFALLAVPALSEASLISVYNAPSHTYQNTANNPCIFYGPGGSGCNQNPAGWPLVGDTGGGDPFDPYPLENVFGDAPGELLQFATLVGRDFLVGLDINDTSTAQSLDNFTITFLNQFGVTIGFWEVNPALLVPNNSANGVGYADYVLAAGCTGLELNGFCTAYAPFVAPVGTRSIEFTFGLLGANDGADKIFLFSAGPTPVPFDEDPPPSVPDGGLTLAMLGSALVGLGYARQRLT